MSRPLCRVRYMLAAAVALCLGGWPLAYAQNGPDRRGEERTKSAEYHGTRANAPIPPELHIRNEGGSNGAGLCVIASLTINGAYQRVGDLEKLKNSDLWRAAKRAPGGYYPQKLENLLNRVMPGEKWFSWEATDLDLARKYSAAGLPIGSTMNTGSQYGYMPIHHMISLVHVDDKLACVVDNNDPGFYHWMPAKEFLRRFPDGGVGWGFVWLKNPAAFRAEVMITLSSVLIGSAGMLLLIGGRRASAS